MLELHCTHTNGGDECRRFLAQLEDGYIVIRCPMCKQKQRFSLADLVAHHVAEATAIQRQLSSEQIMW